MTRLIAGIFLALVTCFAWGSDTIPLKHAISLFGEPKYQKDFKHFDYANPNAPKGGEFRQAVIGQFDSITPYVDRGSAAAGSYLLYDSLLQRSWDEPLSKYGLIAETIELDPDNRWVAYHINPKARFNDGHKVTARDVKFSFDLLREKGSTFYRHFYDDIEKAQVTAPMRVLFTFKTNKNRELPLILGQMPILPEHYWQDRDFPAPGFEVPVTSGPYQIDKINPGRSIIYKRDKNYWGRNLAVNRGRYNFDRMVFEYYGNESVLLQAMFDNQYDFRLITDPTIWNTQLSESKIKKHHLIQEIIKNHNPQTLTLTYNTRRPFLKDARVRESLGYAFNFQQINHNLFFGMYRRAESFFAGSELAATGIPSPAELKWLDPWKKELPKALFHEPFKAPDSQLASGDRLNQAKALKLLKQAGWQIKDNRQVNAQGEPLILNALVATEEHEKVLLSIKDGLSRLGITLNVQRIDPLQMVARVRELDFEIILHIYPHTPSPGTEQASFWGSQTVDQPGTRNVSGVHSPVVDHITQQITSATSRKELLSLIHALDRVLLWGHYSLPLWYPPSWNVLYRDTLKHPETAPLYALDLSTWWHKAKKPPAAKATGGQTHH
ncbi:extracellular solute-binding protein [Endozoicomonas sp. 4G]|uniref:extracellular solute-binding protein n=1 Tax=Endozoicomonas sp. 4G TaxID=2872754 RepID=UPI002078E181|nr:extracellular solute-binding protein [Endozoicomonas sp. 4G]